MAEAPTEDPLVAQAFTKPGENGDQLADAIKQLSPDEAAFFLAKLERAVKKRKIQLLGYLVAIGLWALGMVGALVLFGISDGFVGWAFIAPFGLVGLALWLFGKWGDKIGAPPTEEEIEKYRSPPPT